MKPIALNSPVTGLQIREAMRPVPTPVTVVAVGGERPQGITIGSFVTVSLDPPLVSFNVQRTARMHDRLIQAPRYAVHVLAATQSGLSDIFADPALSGEEQLALAPHTLDEHGLPSLAECLIRFVCIPESTHRAGDHTIFVGRIESLKRVAEGPALLYVQQGYRSVGDF